MNEEQKKQLIKNHNKTKYTSTQILYAIETYGEWDEAQIEKKIEEASNWLDQTLVGTAGTESYISTMLEEGIIKNTELPIDWPKLIHDVTVDWCLFEDEEGNVYREDQGRDSKPLFT